MRDLRGKVVWISGASSGIGAELAVLLAEQGARLILSARRTYLLEDVKRHCPGDPRNVVIVPMDLTCTGCIPDKVREAINVYGRIDILINNAGASQRASAVDTPPDVVRAIMDTNFLGPVLLTTEVVRFMVARRWKGQIVVVTSIAGKIGIPLRSSYCASKHALHGFFDALRAEIASNGIEVLLVVPGLVRTNVEKASLIRDEHLPSYTPYSRRFLMAVNRLIHTKGHAASPASAANLIVRAIRAGNEEIAVGFDVRSRLALILKRFAPGFLSRAMRTKGLTSEDQSG